MASTKNVTSGSDSEINELKAKALKVCENSIERVNSFTAFQSCIRKQLNV